MSKEKLQNDISKLFKLIASIDSPEECSVLFNDLCTKKEIEQMAIRISAARMLLDGKTYQQIIEDTDISSATLSRVSRCVKYGEGYRKFLNKNY